MNFKIGVVALTITVHTASFGMMTAYNAMPDYYKKKTNKRNTISLAVKGLIKQQKNGPIKLIEWPSEQWALGSENCYFKDFPKDLVSIIAQEKDVAKKLRATCRVMNNYCEIPQLKRMHTICGNDTKWLKIASLTMLFDLDFTKDELKATKRFTDDELNQLFEEIEKIKSDRKSSGSYDQNEIDFNRACNKQDLLNRIHCIASLVYGQRIGRVKANNKDLEEALLFAAAIDDVASLKNICDRMSHFKGSKEQKDRQYLSYCLYRDCVLESLRQGSPKSFEFLISHDPFEVKNYHDSPDCGVSSCNALSAGPILWDVQNKIYNVTDKEIQLCQDHGCKTREDIHKEIVDEYLKRGDYPSPEKLFFEYCQASEVLQDYGQAKESNNETSSKNPSSWFGQWCTLL